MLWSFRIPNDRHVLAAAILSRAQVIVTDNTRDFPAEYLARWDIEAKSADDFVLDQISLSRQEVYANVVRIADSRRSPPESVTDVLDQLRASGLVESVAALAEPSLGRVHSRRPTLAKIAAPMDPVAGSIGAAMTTPEGGSQMS